MSFSGILRLLLAVLFPPFELRLAGDQGTCRFATARQQLLASGARIQEETATKFIATIRASKVLSFPTFGTIRVMLYASEDEIVAIARFSTLKKIYYTLSIPLCLFLLLSTAITGDYAALVGVGIVILGGHLAFLGLLPRRTPQVRRFLLE